MKIYSLTAAAAAAAKLHQSCQTLWDPIDGSPPGSAIPGILQARTLEWVAISFSSAWKWSCSFMSYSLRPHGLQPTRLLCSWDFSGKSTGVGCHRLLWPANAGDIKDAGSICGLGRSPGGGHGNPLQCSPLGNPMHRRVWWTTVHGASNSWRQLKWLSTHVLISRCVWVRYTKYYTILDIDCALLPHPEKSMMI